MFADSTTARLAVDGYYFPCRFPGIRVKRRLFEMSGCVMPPFKLVQRGAIHHVERCQWGSASHMGLAGRCAEAAGYMAAPLLF